MKLAWDEDRQGLLIAAMGFVFLGGLALIGMWYRRAGLLGRTVTTEAR
jgi:hypothetical protein